jgi:hypothetical protein
MTAALNRASLRSGGRVNRSAKMRACGEMMDKAFRRGLVEIVEKAKVAAHGTGRGGCN